MADWLNMETRQERDKYHKYIQGKAISYRCKTALLLSSRSHHENVENVFGELGRYVGISVELVQPSARTRKRNSRDREHGTRR